MTRSERIATATLLRAGIWMSMLAPAWAAWSQTPSLMAADGRSVAQLDPSKIVELRQDTVWAADVLKMPNGTVVITNGYNLHIVAGTLNIEGEALIRSFSEGMSVAKRPDKPSRPTDAPSQNRGPESEGPGDGRPGVKGASGISAVPGVNGTDGAAAGTISLRIQQSARGTLYVDNFGLQGSPGGDGGDASNGGNGQQGGRGVPGDKVLGATIGCKRGGGWGGDGGNGGNGGLAGRGGRGGAAGAVIIEVGDITLFKFVPISANGGKAGQNGWPGDEGREGLAGYGGRGATGCHGEEYRRIGSRGVQGIPGEMPSKSDDGKPGCISVSKAIRQKGGFLADAAGCLVGLKHDNRTIANKAVRSPRVPANAPSGEELYLVWEKIGQRFPNVSSKSLVLPKGGTAGFFSLTDSPAFITALRARVEEYVRAKPVRTETCDMNTLIARMFSAQMSNAPNARLEAQLDCIERIPLDGATTYRDLARAAFVLGFIDLVAIELSRSSFVAASATDKALAQIAERDRIYLLWPSGPAQERLVTRFDEELIARLLVVADALQGNLFAAMNEEGIGVNAIACTKTAEIRRVDWSAIPKHYFSFGISTGSPVDAWTSRSQSGSRHITIRVKSSPYRTFLSTARQSTDDFAWKPTPIPAYSEFLAGRPDSNAFPCVGPGGDVNRILEDPNGPNLLNNMPASLTLFGSFYLQSLYAATKLSEALNHDASQSE